MAFAHYVIFSLLMAVSLSQRPSYAGSRPIGYPTVEETTVASTTNNNLNNRFGVRTTTTEILPLEALGDRRLLERLFKLPLDNQPFWLLNWRALNEERNQPKTYTLRRNSYID